MIYLVDDVCERRIVNGEVVERARRDQLALTLLKPRGRGRLAVEGLGLGMDDVAAALETDLRGVPNCPILALSGCDGSHDGWGPLSKPIELIPFIFWRR